MENKKMVIDDLTYDEVGLLCTALKTTIIKMKELEVPEFFIETAISLFNQVEVILDTKVAEQKTFIELINDQLDDVAIASEIIEKDPDVVIPEYK
jgi:predicted HTH domain antitoxin